MGVFQIRNTVNGKLFVGSTMDLSAVFSGIRFQLYAGAHFNKALETDWKRYGTGRFEFEILEELSSHDDANQDYAADLETLENIWLEKLQPYGERGYNEPKKTQEEHLRIISQNREQ